MKHLLESGKAILITGPEGSGKTIIARALAMACKSSWAVATEYEMKNPFDCGNILEVRPEVLVVDEVSDLEWAKNLITNDKIEIHRKGKNPEIINAPNFIFVSGSVNPLKLDANNRRFITLEIDRQP